MRATCVDFRELFANFLAEDLFISPAFYCCTEDRSHFNVFLADLLEMLCLKLYISWSRKAEYWPRSSTRSIAAHIRISGFETRAARCKNVFTDVHWVTLVETTSVKCRFSFKMNRTNLTWSHIVLILNLKSRTWLMRRAYEQGVCKIGRRSWFYLC